VTNEDFSTHSAFIGLHFTFLTQTEIWNLAEGFSTLTTFFPFPESFHHMASVSMKSKYKKLKYIIYMYGNIKLNSFVQLIYANKKHY
jgi:hypothetical protein